MPTRPPPKRRLDDLCAPGSKGRRHGAVVPTRTTVLQLPTRHWVGPCGGTGTGDSRGDRTAALGVVRTSLPAGDPSQDAGIVRVDGHYGDRSVSADMVRAGRQVVVRGRG
jgi:hypothetical protein